MMKTSILFLLLPLELLPLHLPGCRVPSIPFLALIPIPLVPIPSIPSIIIVPSVIVVSSSPLGAIVVVTVSVPAVMALVVLPEVIAFLVAIAASALLSAFLVPWVHVHPDDLLAQPGLRYILDCPLRIFMPLIDHKAKPTTDSFIIDPHNNTLNFARAPKQFLDRILGDIVGQVAHIDGGGHAHCLVVFLLRFEVVLVVVF